MSDPPANPSGPESAGSQPGQEVAADQAGSPRSGQAFRRWTVVLLTVGAIAAVYYRPLLRNIRRTVASYHADSASESLRAGDTSAALEAVDQALGWLPKDAALIYLRAQIHAKNKNWAASLADYSQVTDHLAPNFAVAYLKRAEVHQRQANFHEAIKDLDRAVALSPSDSPEVLNHRAYVCAQAGEDLQQALADIQRAMRLFEQQAQDLGRNIPMPAAFIDTLGYIRFRLGEHEAALEDIEKALRTLSVRRSAELERLTKLRQSVGPQMRQFDEMQGEILYHRGEVLEALGDAERAAEDFELAAELGYRPPTAR